tara:strand:+ start:49 stop:996 length:948 start_codon:yes stop_codon:yes gene_type:complete
MGKLPQNDPIPITVSQDRSTYSQTTAETPNLPTRLQNVTSKETDEVRCPSRAGKQNSLFQDGFVYVFNPDFIFKVVDPANLQVEQLPMDLQNEKINDIVVDNTGVVYAATSFTVRRLENETTTAISQEKFDRYLPGYIELIGADILLVGQRYEISKSELFKVDFSTQTTTKLDFSSEIGVHHLVDSLSSNTSNQYFFCGRDYSQVTEGKQPRNSLSVGSSLNIPQSVKSELAGINIQNTKCYSITGRDNQFYVHIHESGWVKSGDSGSTFTKIPNFEYLAGNRDKIVGRRRKFNWQDRRKRWKRKSRSSTPSRLL